MVFLFIFLIIIAIIITMKIKIEIQNLKFTTNEKPHLNRKYQIKIKIYTFGILPIINIKLNNKKIKKYSNINKRNKFKNINRDRKCIINSIYNTSYKYIYSNVFK